MKHPRLRLFLTGIFFLLVISLNQIIQASTETPTTTEKSNDKILFVSLIPNSGWELFSVKSDGTNLQQLTTLKNLPDAHWSKDGQYIALRTFPPGFSTTLILSVMNADGTHLHKVSENVYAGDIKWSPDSQQIAFISIQDGLREIYVADRDGRGETRLTYSNDDVISFSWSPDGKQLIFVRPYQMYIINSDGTNEKLLAQPGDNEMVPTWSPDGKTIVFVMTHNQQAAIYTMSPDGSNRQKMIDLPTYFTGLDWSPDGMRIGYTPKIDGVVSLFIVEIDSKISQKVAENISGFSWSPDGKQIVFSQYDAQLNSTMYISSFDGTNRKVLVGNNASDHSPKWSPAK